MRIGAYYTLFNSVEYGMPLVESVNAMVSAVDTVALFVDPSSGGRTTAAVEWLNETHPALVVHALPCPFDDANPLGAWKTQARALMDTEWLLEADPLWVIPPDRRYLRDVVESCSPGSVMVSFGSVNLFNGDNVKDAHPTSLPILSRNLDGLIHGGEGRLGSALVWDSGVPIGNSMTLGRGERPGRRVAPTNGWVYNYEWYSLPLQYELKQFTHYVEGRLSGRYASVNDYTVGPDGNRVSLHNFVVRLPTSAYIDSIRDEMLDKSIRGVHVTHPDGLLAWTSAERVHTVRAPRWLRAVANTLGGAPWKTQ